MSQLSNLLSRMIGFLSVSTADQASLQLEIDGLIPGAIESGITRNPAPIVAAVVPLFQTGVSLLEAKLINYVENRLGGVPPAQALPQAPVIMIAHDGSVTTSPVAPSPASSPSPAVAIVAAAPAVVPVAVAPPVAAPFGYDPVTGQPLAGPATATVQPPAASTFAQGPAVLAPAPASSGAVAIATPAGPATGVGIMVAPPAAVAPVAPVAVTPASLATPADVAQPARLGTVAVAPPADVVSTWKADGYSFDPITGAPL